MVFRSASPAAPPQNTTWLTLASAVALRRALEAETGLNPQIKWPNDILVNGLKVAGILTEISAELDRIKYAVVGIGVDVNLNAGEFQPDLRKTATSLKLALGHPVSRPELAVVILRELDADYQRLAEGRFDSVEENGNGIASRWASKSSSESAIGRFMGGPSPSARRAPCWCAPNMAGSNAWWGET